MVGLLGSLGIDWKILIIQSLNFLVLFLLLKKIFFEPFIGEVKREKKEKDNFEKEKNKIEIEKENWQRKKDLEISEVRGKIGEILDEAEKISAEIKERAATEARNKEEETINQVKERKEDIILEYKNSFIKSYREEIKRKMENIISQKISEEAKKEIQKDFWQKFFILIKTCNFPREQILLKKKKYLTKGGKGKRIKIKANFSSAFPIEEKLISGLSLILKEKINEKEVEIILEKKVDKSLIAGFSLEFMGVLVENSLNSEIEKIIS